MPKLTPIRPWRLTALGLASAALVAGCVGLDTQQRKWIFQAQAAPLPAAGQADAITRSDGFEDVWIEHTPDGVDDPVKLHALWLAPERNDAPLLLYLHGARRDVESSAFRIEQMHELGFGVLAIDYRGFGRSTDVLPSETTVAEDAQAGWRWLAERFPGRPRYVFGHSLGGAIAVRLASEVDDAAGLIVEGTFPSIAAVFRSFKWGWLPIEPLITQRFEAARQIEKVKAPVLIVHGENDGLIPVELGRTLFEHAKGRKRFVMVEGGTHYSTNRLGRNQYRTALKELFGLGA